MQRQELHYHLLDVFTREPFGGNQLAVFPDAAGIPAELMPRIARELNLSETVFVLPPRAGGLARLRIFTPGMELPFAGHPTLGTACLLASLGRRTTPRVGSDSDPIEMILEEEVGDVRVVVRPGDERTPPWAQLTSAHPPEVRPPDITVQQLARLLRIDASDIAPGDERVPGAAAVSCGVPFLFIPVVNLAALARCRLDLGEWTAQVAGSWAPHVFVYTMMPADGVRGRMFAPAMGIVEDPATGAAGTALAGLLAGHTGSDGTRRWTLTQGIEMGRPGILELEADVQEGSVTACRVGGHSVIVGEGAFRLPLRQRE